MAASMFSRFVKNYPTFSAKISRYLSNNAIRAFSSGTSVNGEGDSSCETKDVEQLFLDERVQTILHQITGFGIQKVMRPRQQPMRPPKYLLLTDEQLKEIESDASARAEERLQMPPVMKSREPINEVLSEDSDLKGLLTSKLVFTDITFGLSDRDRFIVVREPDGTLRKATWEERAKCLQIYFPHEGRKLRMPKMFEEQQLENVLREGRYEYILDRACVQFEPDEPTYIRVIGRTYTHIDQHKKYDVLRSTRHFGGMTFYLVLHKKLDYLLVDMLQRDLLKDAIQLVQLHNILHPESETAQAAVYAKISRPLELIKTYIEKDAVHKGEIELALQSYEEEHIEQENSL